MNTKREYIFGPSLQMNLVKVKSEVCFVSFGLGFSINKDLGRWRTSHTVSDTGVSPNVVRYPVKQRKGGREIN
ncbi:UNVERIFIED_CONTAM: hypothetical protein K2H54_041000 [Gekko kuhli]